MTSIRRKVLLSWVAFVLLGTFWIVLGAGSVRQEWIARGDLSRNHLLQERDVARGKWGLESARWFQDEIVGRYVIGDRSAGASLGAEDLAKIPTPASKTPEVAIIFDVERDAIQKGLFNAGTPVPLCYGDRAFPDKASVMAVFCQERSMGGCWALVSLLGANLQWFAAAGADSLVLDFNPRPGLRCRVDLPTISRKASGG